MERRPEPPLVGRRLWGLPLYIRPNTDFGFYLDYVAMPPRDPFNRHLPQRLHIRDGPTLATVADARAYVLSLPPERTARAQWQHAIQLMLDSSAPVESIWRALKLALLYDAALDVSRTQ